MDINFNVSPQMHLFRMDFLAAVLVCSTTASAIASDYINSSNKFAWSENAGWMNLRPAHGGILINADHLSGHAWLENLGWLKLGSDGAGPYQNTTATNWGVNRDVAGNLSGFAWSETWGWINFRPTGGGVNIDPVTKVFDGYAWGENIGWIHLKSPLGVPVSYEIEATSSISGNVSTDGQYAWSENLGWVNYRPTDGGMTIHADHLTGFVWQENIGWLKLGADAGGPYLNSSSTNWGVNRDEAGKLSGYAWCEGWGWVNFGPGGGGLYINPLTGTFDGYAWGENIGWISFASPPEAAVSYKVGLVSYILTLDFSGTGNGTVVSVLPPFSCNSDCTQAVLGDTQLNLSAAASQYSLFSGWSGCDTINGADVLLAMDRDRTATVTFNLDSIHITRIDGTPPFFFATLQKAYDSPASSSNTIKVWGIDLPETLLCGASKQVSISGGYDQLYQSRPNTTTIRGLVIGKGSVVIDRIVVK